MTTINIPVTKTNNLKDDASGKSKSAFAINEQHSAENRMNILCFDLSRYGKSSQFIFCCIGVFSLFLVYGYLQELIFTLNGFKPYGWYLTLVQFFYYTVFGFIERLKQIGNRKIPIKTYLILAGLTLGTMGFSNSSLGYLNYPTEVIFKSCKLVPVLIGSILIQNKKHSFIEFLAAFCMCIGLALFTLADSNVSPSFNMFGVILILLALLCDAAIGNVQEKCMREHQAPNNEVVFYSYGIGFMYLLIIMLFTGDFIQGTIFCMDNPVKTYGYAFIFSITGYLGIQIVLNLVRTMGAPIAALVTTARKAVTICLSFILFAKPFTMQYIWSGLVVVFGIYLNVYSKKNKLSFVDIMIKLQNILFYFRSNHSDSKPLLQNV